MSGDLAKRVDANAVPGAERSPGTPATDFIALARPEAVPAGLVALEDELEMIRSCLDTPFYRAMIEDLRNDLAALIGWLSRPRGMARPG